MKKWWWLLLVNLFMLAVVGVGSFFAYKTYIDRSLAQAIELKKKQLAPSLAYDLQEGNTGHSRVIAYFPKGKDGKRISSLEQKMYASIEKKIGRKPAKGAVDRLYLLMAKEEKTNFPKVRKERLHSISYHIKGAKLDGEQSEDEGSLFLTEDNQPFDLTKLFSNSQPVVEAYAKQLVDEIGKLGKSEDEKNQAVADLKKLDLASLDFSYDNSQLTLHFPSDLAGVRQLSLPVSTLYDEIKVDYLTETDKKEYEAYLAEQEAKKNQLRIAITFDDGPSPETTPQVLDLLKKYKVKATFFVLGKNIAGNEAILKRMQAEGHEIANHSWNHPQLTKLAADQIKQEIEDTQSAIQAVTGQRPTSYRPPYGAVNQAVQAVTNLPAIYWTVDTLDWKSKNPAAILGEVKAHTQAGSIILMHDIHPTTVASLDSVLAYLTGQGYSFARVDELLGKNINPQYVYYSQSFAGPAQ
ncbi:polysaccharide deacetylase family protein [Streptococcus gallolyticus]|nr:polysaccharide deacetylase family protein [Streptococcus gallolyticus]MBY5040091.1 polysaccharide deacetylase family protein [Streptococcus gallolyticus]